MEKCNSCRCNQGCNKSCNNRCSYNMEQTPCQQARRAARDYTEMPTNTCNQEVYDCPQIANDEVGCMPIAMAYVPWQQWGDVYTAECGLEHGTIFPELVKPVWVYCGQRD